MSFFYQLSLSFSQIGLFWQEKINGVIFRWNIFFILSEAVLIFFKFNDLPPQLPLYYSRPWGESQLATSSLILLLPLLSLIILILNNFLAVFLLKSMRLFSRLLIIVSLIFSMFSAVTLFRIVYLIS